MRATVGLAAFFYMFTIASGVSAPAPLKSDCDQAHSSVTTRVLFDNGVATISFRATSSCSRVHAHRAAQTVVQNILMRLDWYQAMVSMPSPIVAAYRWHPFDPLPEDDLTLRSPSPMAEADHQVFKQIDVCDRGRTPLWDKCMPPYGWLAFE